MRYRKNPRRKRRLAYARSGLMVNFGGSKESEYWSFPLPPISPKLTGMKSSASSMDVRALKVKVLAEELFYFLFFPPTDGSRLHAGLACVCPKNVLNVGSLWNFRFLRSRPAHQRKEPSLVSPRSFFCRLSLLIKFGLFAKFRNGSAQVWFSVSDHCECFFFLKQLQLN